MPKVFRPFQSDSAAGKNGANVNSVVYQRTGAQGVPSQQQVTKVRNWQKPFDPKTQLQILNRDFFAGAQNATKEIDLLAVANSRNGNLIPAPEQFKTNSAKFATLAHLWKQAIFIDNIVVDKSSNSCEGRVYMQKDVCDLLLADDPLFYYVCKLHCSDVPENFYSTQANEYQPNYFPGVPVTRNGVEYYDGGQFSLVTVPGMGAHFTIGQHPEIEIFIGKSPWTFTDSVVNPVIDLNVQYTYWKQLVKTVQA